MIANAVPLYLQASSEYLSRLQLTTSNEGLLFLDKRMFGDCVMQRQNKSVFSLHHKDHTLGMAPVP